MQIGREVEHGIAVAGHRLREERGVEAGAHAGRRDVEDELHLLRDQGVAIARPEALVKHVLRSLVGRLHLAPAERAAGSTEDDRDGVHATRPLLRQVLRRVLDERLPEVEGDGLDGRHHENVGRRFSRKARAASRPSPDA